MHHASAHARVLHLQNHRVDQPVVHQHAIAFTHIVGQRIVGNGDLARSRGILWHEHDVAPFGEHHGLLERSHADSWTLEIRDNGYWLLALERDGTHCLDGSGMLCVSAMREVDARYIQAGVDQGANHLGR
jgi:hypothetical protein